MRILVDLVVLVMDQVSFVAQREFPFFSQRYLLWIIVIIEFKSLTNLVVSSDIFLPRDATLDIFVIQRREILSSVTNTKLCIYCIPMETS